MGVFVCQHPDTELGRLPADLLKGHHRAADNPVSKKSVVEAVDWSAACRGELVQRLPRGEGSAGSILKHRQVEHHRVIRQSRQLVAQVRQRKVGQPRNGDPVLEGVYLSAQFICHFSVPRPVAGDDRHLAGVWMQPKRYLQGGGSALGDRDSSDLCIFQVLWMRIACHGTLNDRHSSEQLGPVFQQKLQGCPADGDHDIGRTFPILIPQKIPLPLLLRLARKSGHVQEFAVKLDAVAGDQPRMLSGWPHPR